MAAVPAKVMCVASTQVSVTLPAAPSTGVEKVPALAVRVRVRVSPSTSANVTAERSTLLATSSVTVISVGAPVRVGAVFAVMVMLKVVSPITPPALSATVNLKLSVVTPP